MKAEIARVQEEADTRQNQMEKLREHQETEVCGIEIGMVTFALYTLSMLGDDLSVSLLWPRSLIVKRGVTALDGVNKGGGEEESGRSYPAGPEVCMSM